MKLSTFCDYVIHELMRDISGISVRQMFGGYCLYKDGKVFGMIANDILYFKVGKHNKAEYEQYGSKQFTYTNKGKEYAMSYWEVPQEIQDDSGELKEWVGKALMQGMASSTMI